MIRNRATAKQLCEHPQCLVGEILVEKRFLSGESFRGTARRLIVLVSLSRDDLWAQLSDGREAIHLLFIHRIVGLPKNELSTGCVVSEIEPVEHSGAQRPAMDGASGSAGVDAPDQDVYLGAVLERLKAVETITENCRANKKQNLAVTRSCEDSHCSIGPD